MVYYMVNLTLFSLHLQCICRSSPLFSSTSSKNPSIYQINQARFHQTFNHIFFGQNLNGLLTIRKSLFSRSLQTAVKVNEGSIEKMTDLNTKERLFYEKTKVSIKHSTFIECHSSDNELSSDGGAVLVEWGLLNISYSGFIKNKAINSGGAVSTRFCENVSLEHLGFYSNQAGYSTGAYLSYMSFEVNINDLNSSCDISSYRSSSLSFLSSDTVNIKLSIYYNTTCLTGAAVCFDAGFSKIDLSRFFSANTSCSLNGLSFASGKVASSFFTDTLSKKSPIVWKSEGVIFVDNCYFKMNRQKIIAYNDGFAPLKVLDNNIFDTSFPIIAPSRIRTKIPPTPTPAPTPTKLLHRARPTKTASKSPKPTKKVVVKKEDEVEKKVPKEKNEEEKNEKVQINDDKMAKTKIKTRKMAVTMTASISLSKNNKIPFNPARKRPKKILDFNLSPKNVVIAVLVLIIGFLVWKLLPKERKPGTAEETFYKFGNKTREAVTLYEDESIF